MNDVIVEEGRRVRELLIEKHGGIDGYFKHCQEQERRALRARRKARARKQSTVVTRKARKPE